VSRLEVAVWSPLARLAVFVAALVVVPFPARGASPAAEALFEEGRRLLEDGHTDEACMKFAESLAQDASSGILLNLALCHETQGRVATAWAEYRAAARLSRTQGRPDRAKAAEERARLLEPRLPRLTLTLERATPGLKVTIDGVAIGEGALGVAVPIDPGVHLVTVDAPGHLTWTTTLTIEGAVLQTLQIPALEPEPPRPTPRPTPSPASAVSLLRVAPLPTAPHPAAAREETPGRSRLVAGLIVGGAGVAALGIGVGFGLSSLASYESADELCPSPHRECTEGAISERTTAERAAWISNVAFGVGLVGIGAGTYLVLTSGSSARREKRVVLRATPVREGAWFGVSSAF
jgi:hypothetical protein